ncbi:hypothetical protein [Lactococcus allomyrinae]|uniref:PARP catalytic domain-containing protein n=1 Tax=Lactococcus allomyrinae TaxID=2419773 RepID=A0A387BFB2_9LACT|nr:hypothetical protein [Lactococcus allomyrinae]AYF99795.1 hypothetical protein D7I46_01070 [Lactococcus allomyrinae]
MTIENFYIALNKILKHEKLDVDEALFFLEETNDVLNKENIWQFLGLSETMLEETELPFNMTDSIFKAHNRIGKVFAVENVQELSRYKHVCYGAHGTKNDNVLSILSNGFVSSDKVKAVAFSGQMFGEGVYMCRLSQFSKVLNYISSPSTSTPSYAFLMKIGYNKKIDVTSSRSETIQPGELVHAHDIGMYSRDEYVVADSSQIAITHIVEIFEKNN